MYLYLYKMTDPRTKEYYIGSRMTEIIPEEDEYLGSMVTWAREENFNKSILIKEIIRKDFDNFEEMIEAESDLISLNFKDPLNKNYHIPNKGFCNHGRKWTDEQKKNQSERRSGIKLGPQNPETIKKRVDKLKGKKRTDEQKMKMSDSHKGKKLGPQNEEHKQKIREAQSLISDETRKKRSDSIKEYYKNNPISEERRQKLREASRNQSPESLKKRSDAQKGIPRGPMSDEQKIKIKESKSKRDNSHNEETKLKISESGKGRRWITNGEISRTINKDEKIPEGWIFGRKIKK